jgi:steroid delta-isomerase-like uncharacterized protein
MKMAVTEAMVRSFAAAWTTRNRELLLANYATDCVYEDVTLGVVNRGKDDLGKFFDETVNASDDYAVEITNFFLADDKGAFEWVMSGTHTGDFPNIPKTGKRFSVRGISYAEFDGDTIRHQRDYWDLKTFLSQLGVSQ